MKFKKGFTRDFMSRTRKRMLNKLIGINEERAYSRKLIYRDILETESYGSMHLRDQKCFKRNSSN